MSWVEPVRFTGVVVTFNEAERLEACLSSLRFVDQLIVADLGSTDASVEIAERHGARVLHLERVPIVEHVRARAVEEAAHDWIVTLDPDEVLPPGARERFEAAIRADPELGEIRVPWQFYFRGRRLDTTAWSGSHKRFVLHRARLELRRQVHADAEPKPGFHTHVLERSDDDFAVAHYWIDSYPQLVEKHFRYLSQEGEAHHAKGHRFSWRRVALSTAGALQHSLWVKRGIRGGARGVALSLFYASYIGAGWLALRRYERRLAEGDVGER